MDNSTDLSTNEIEVVNMGNILSSTNENDAETTAAITTNNGSENFEVSCAPNQTQPDNTPFAPNILCDNLLISETDNSVSKINIELSNSESVASSSQKTVSSNADENADTWLDGNTSELVKDDNEEDFDVIVKSLETAIVETEHDDPKPKQETVNSSIIYENVERDSPMSSLIETMEQDVPLLEKNDKKQLNMEMETETSSIVSASSEENDVLNLNTTVESNESDFTLYLEEDQDTEKSSKKENVQQETPIENVLSGSSDIKIISVTSIVDYDDSSDEDEETNSIDAEKNIDNTTKSIKIENTEKEVDNEIKIENSTRVQESIDKIIKKVLIENPENMEPTTSTIEKEMIEITEAILNSPEKKSETTIQESSEIDQNQEIKNVAEKIMPSLEDSEEKPRTPPKKIKLVRQKLPTALKKIESVVEAVPMKEQVIEPEKSDPIEVKIFNLKPEEEKSDSKLEESFESDEKLFSEIFKIEDEVETKPVKTQKLKLKRNYRTPPVVYKSQVMQTSARIPEVAVKTTETDKQPVKIIESVKEVVETFQEPVVEPATEIIESDIVEEPVKITQIVEKPVKPINIPESIKESPVEIPEIFVKEPAIIPDTLEKEPVTCPDTFVKEPVKIDEVVEEISIKIPENVEETPLIIPEIIKENPVEIPEIINKESIENPVKITEIVEEEPTKIPEIVKEEPTKIPEIVEEEPTKIPEVDKEDPCTIPEVEPVKIPNIFNEEPSIINETIEEEPVKIPEVMEIIQTLEEPNKELIKNIEEFDMIEKPTEMKETEPVVEEKMTVETTINIEEEQPIIEEKVALLITPEKVEESTVITEKIAEFEVSKNMDEKEKEIIKDEEIESVTNLFTSVPCETKNTEVENITNVIIEDKIPEEFISETDKIIESPLIDDLSKNDEISTKQNIEIENKFEKSDEQNIIEISIKECVNENITEHVEINEELQEEIIPGVKETLQVSEILTETIKTPEPIISEPEKIVATETIEKIAIIENPDSIITTEKCLDNLPETMTETEEAVNTLTKIQFLPSILLPETEKNEQIIDIPVKKTEVETIIPTTEKLLKESKSPEIKLDAQVIATDDETKELNFKSQIVNMKKADNIEPTVIEKAESLIESEPKKFEGIQFPLLMSRLQDKLHANMPKSNKNLVKLFAPQVEIQKPEKSIMGLFHAIEQPETSTSTSNMNIKFRTMKRKHESEHSSRSITKPLTVEIDDLESSDAMMQPGEQENIPKLVIKQRSSPKITIKPIKPPGSPEVTSKRSKLASENSPNTTTTPRLTIKPVVKPSDPLKITITKQKSDDTHSILKIYQPDEDLQHMDDTHVPKLTIKSIPKSDEMQHSPKITIKPVKPPGSPKITVKSLGSPKVSVKSCDQNIERSHSPKVTVKPIINPEENYPKVTIKPVLKPEETHKMTQISPRQLKLKSMTFDSSSGVTVEPICSTSCSNIQSEHESPMKISVKPFAKLEEISGSPKLTIKPLTKTCEIVQSEDGTANPLKLTIKPILKPEESYQSPKITIKPIVKPDDHDQHTVTEEIDKPERIILKIQKTNLPSPKERTSSHVRKESEIKIEAIPPTYNPENNQKLDKIKLKLTKEGSHAQIISSITTSRASTETNTSFSLKRSLPITNASLQEKRQKTEFSELLHSSDISINLVEPHSRQNIKQISEEVTIMKIDKTPSTSGSTITSVESITQMRLKEMLMKISQKPEITCTPHVKQIQLIQQQRLEDSSSSDDVRIVEVMEDPLRDPLNEDSCSQDVLIINEVIETNPFKNVQIINAQTVVEPVQQQPFIPKKRGRPRKVPLEVRPEIKGEDCVLADPNVSAGESPEGGRPKRTCRAPAGRTPFAVKERKPRGSGRGRGSTRGVRGAKALTAQKIPKEPKSPRSKALKVAKALAKLEAAKLAQEVIIDAITIEDSTNDNLTNINVNAMPQAESFLKKPEISVEMVEPHSISMGEITDVVKNTSMSEIKNTSVSVYEEETRMSASENNSRAQTPARQVFIVPLSAEGPEESQSSVQSSATTESTKNKKGRLEICDPDSAHTTVEQIVEYSWGNGGPYMLQEQIAQFLGVKSFKRKYPGLTRRPVDMQERDYIKEKGLVSESMCDMGLTAVPSSEILDIMYTDFQEKYEEYRKCLRDKQSKEISNKQKAISLATSQEKNKLDFKERAIRSTANWNATFNKSRKESRKCCMDLQTFTVNYPIGKNYPRVPYKNPVGSYPIALVPGQFTDYYKAYSGAELNYLPLNTVRFGPIVPNQRCLEASDGSSESDSSSGSDSDSSDESMSTDDEAPSTPVPKHLTPLITTTPKTKVH